MYAIVKMEAESNEKHSQDQEVKDLEMEYTATTGTANGYLAWVCTK